MKGIERTFTVEHKALPPGRRHVLRHRIQSDFVAGHLALKSSDPRARLFHLAVGDRPLFDMDEGILVSELAGDLLGTFPLLNGIAMRAGLDLRLDVVFGQDDPQTVENDAAQHEGETRNAIPGEPQSVPVSSLLVIVRAGDETSRLQVNDEPLFTSSCDDPLFTPEEIAEVCHEANRALTRHTKDVPVQPAWDEAPEEMRTSSIAGVRWRLDHLDAPASAQHEEWMRAKIEDGWGWGDVKDPAMKTHPALVPYDELPEIVKVKDAVFTALVVTLAEAPSDWPLVSFMMPAEWYAVVEQAAAKAGVTVEQYVKTVVANEANAVVNPKPKTAVAEAVEKLEAMKRRAGAGKITDDDLKRWFTYHPPTEDTLPHYKAVRAAEVECFKVVETLLTFYSRTTAELNGGEPPSWLTDDERVAHHAATNDVLLAFARVVLEHAPDSADRTASIRSIRLARNALNEAIAMKNPDSYRGPALRELLFDRAVTAIYDARWQAASAVACAGR